MKRIKISDIVFAVLIVIIGFIPLVTRSSYIFSLMFNTFLWALCGQAWNIIAGYTGQWSLGHALFFGLGAYGVVMAQYLLGLNPLVGLFLGMLICIPFVFIISGLSFRLGNIYFIMATLVFPLIVQILIGHYTYSKSEDIVIGGWQGFVVNRLPLTPLQFYYIMFLLVILSIILVKFLERSRQGYFMKATRDDERLALSLGINTNKIKTLAMFISAMLTSVAGSIYAIYTGYIAPTSVFDFSISMNIILGAIVGGLGTVYGPFFGALVVFPLFQLIQGWVGGKFIGLTYILSGFFLMSAYLIRLRFRAKSPLK